MIFLVCPEFIRKKADYCPLLKIEEECLRCKATAFEISIPGLKMCNPG